MDIVGSIIHYFTVYVKYDKVYTNSFLPFKQAVSPRRWLKRTYHKYWGIGGLFDVQWKQWKRNEVSEMKREVMDCSEVQKRIERPSRGICVWGALKLIGDNLKFVWTELSTKS